MLDKLEKRFGGYTIRNVTLHLIVGQSFIYVLFLSGQFPMDSVALIPERVLAGEVWRVLTFMLVPPLTNPIFALFAWYLFYLMGSSLEGYWGAFRYNVYLLIGYLAAVAVSFLTPSVPSGNVYIMSSVFLAFAFLNPNFVIFLFFILPVRVKWLALLTWLGYGVMFLFGGWTERALVFAATCNFMLFFGGSIAAKVKLGRRRMAFQAKEFARRNEPFHRCTICGITEKTHPDMDFRYCVECKPERCYCQEHVFDHEHRAESEDEESSGGR